MQDFNYSKSPEPVVTVARPLFTKNTIWYVLALALATAGAWFYWQSMNEIPETVVVPVVESPLTDAETELYRDSLERVSSDGVGASSTPEQIEAPESSVKEADPDSAKILAESNNSSQGSFVPPSSAVTIDLATIPSVTSETEGTPAIPVTETAYLQGDVTLLNFEIEAQDTTGTPVQKTATVHSNDSGSQSLLVASGGEVYSLKTDSAKITTVDGKVINQSSLKKDDIVTVSGTLLSSGQIIIAQSIVLVGVQDYLIQF